MPDNLEQFRAMTPEQLREEGLLIEDKIRDLLLGDDGEMREKVSQSEQHRVDELMRKRDFIRNRVEAHNQAQRSFRGRSGRNFETAYMNLGHGGQDIEGAEVLHMRGQQARDAALRLLESNRQLAPDQLDRTEKLIRGDRTDEARDDSYVAKRTLLTENAAYRSGWQRLMTEPRPLLNVEEVEALRAFEKFERQESRAMGEVTPSAGGFGVPVFIDASIIMTAQGSGNPFLTLAKIAEVTTNVWKGVTSAGVTWSFDTEGSAVSDDSPALAQPSVIVHMPRGFLPYSIEVGMDYPDFASEMATLLAEGYDELLVDKFSRGSGTGEPQGIITALDADTNVEVLLTTAGAFGDTDVYNVWKALPQRFRRKASWMMSVGVNNGIRRMGTANLGHAYTTNLIGETVDKLFNKQVYEGTYFPDLVNTTGHFNQVVVGDFGNYQIARRAGMSTELIPNLFDITNNRPTGQRGWFAWARIGGGVSNNQGFRLLNQT
jgi:HK97 family phage major capsid protein